MRKAIINRDTCKPTDCASSENKPCIKYCPGNRTGLETIVLGADGFPHINPLFCTGCGICVKKCPFHCYKIINLPGGKKVIEAEFPDGSRQVLPLDKIKKIINEEISEEKIKRIGKKLNNLGKMINKIRIKSMENKLEKIAKVIKIATFK